MQDRVGNEIEIGTLVAYPSRKRSKMWLGIIRVHAMTDDTLTGMSLLGRQVTVKKTDQIVVVHEPRQ